MLYLLFVFQAFLPIRTKTTDSPKNQLTVQVQNTLSKKGAVYFALYSPNSKFPTGTPLIGQRVEVTADPVQATFMVEPGTYAIAIFQDENGNGKMDKNFFGVPTEPYGMSNNFRPRFSAPKFNDCQFHVGSEAKTVRIEVKRFFAD